MLKYFFPFIFIAINIFLPGCADEKSGPTQAKPATVETPKEVSPGGNVVPDAKFVIGQFRDDDNPTSTIDVSVNGKVTTITKIAGIAETIDKMEYAEKEIPANSITACGAWWAGAGDYFYMIVSGGKVQVWQGWQAEEQEDKGYHWKEIKVLMP